MRLPADMVSSLRPLFDSVPVCVTGGAGFIGGHLVDALLSLGADIAVIDDLSSSTADHLAGLMDLEPDRVRLIHASILDHNGLEAAVRGSKLVFHLAAIGSVPRSVEDPARSWQVNATGTMRVLEAAQAAGAHRVVFSASSSAYGDSESQPKVETQLPNPISPYAAAKLAAEHLCRAWSHTYGLSTVSLRYFNVFGPRQPADSDYAAVIPAFAAKLMSGQRPVIFGDGEQTRDFTPVSNVVAANLLAASTTASLRGQAVNIGSGGRITINELARNLAERLGRPELTPEHLPERVGDVRDSLADIAAAAELFGYAPVIPVADGLEEVAAWFADAASQENAP